MPDDQSKTTALTTLAGVIRRSAYSTWVATLVGNAAPKVQAMYERMKAPQVGDWVIETSTAYMPSRDLNAVGILLRIEQEPVDFGEGAEPWDEAVEGRSHPTEPAAYIRTIDGREFRWINASFIAISMEPANA